MYRETRLHTLLLGRFALPDPNCVQASGLFLAEMEDRVLTLWSDASLCILLVGQEGPGFDLVNTRIATSCATASSGVSTKVQPDSNVRWVTNLLLLLGKVSVRLTSCFPSVWVAWRSHLGRDSINASKMGQARLSSAQLSKSTDNSARDPK